MREVRLAHVTRQAPETGRFGLVPLLEMLNDDPIRAARAGPFPDPVAKGRSGKVAGTVGG